MQTTDEITASPNDTNFESLQEKFKHQFDQIFHHDLVEKTVVIIPSLTLDVDILQAIKGVTHYEERMLCLLMLLRMPRTQIIFVSSVPIDSSIIDYYLHLLPGITGYHARQRLTLLSCYDASHKSLTEKILERPRLIRRIRHLIRHEDMTHMACFNVTHHEKQLALALGIPIFGCDPKLLHLGTKSGSREIFKKAGVDMPAGVENLKTEHDIAVALSELKTNNSALEKAVVKMDEGFSGEGNAIFYYQDLPADAADLENIILQNLPSNLKVVAPGMSYREFINKFEVLGGIAEEFIPGENKQSPSVQCRINPNGDIEICSTHDQELGGESGQVFLGATFPANNEYSTEICTLGKIITTGLQKEGVIGRFGIDFISVKEPSGWKHYAIEINLRKGGTTHPFLMLQFLTGGEFDWSNSIFIMPNGQSRCYFASDNVVNEKYKGLTPHDLIDIAMCNSIQYNGALQTGVMFHMIGALSQYGKLGMVCIGKTIEEAKQFYFKTIEVLDRECSN